MGDKTFKGRIKEGAKYCYASYPGKFKTGFVALTSDEGEFSEQSVACVYFCTKEDGLGKHHTDPEDPKGRCFCRWIYGEGNDLNRDYETCLGFAREDRTRSFFISFAGKILPYPSSLNVHSHSLLLPLRLLLLMFLCRSFTAGLLPSW